MLLVNAIAHKKASKRCRHCNK